MARMRATCGSPPYVNRLSFENSGYFEAQRSGILANRSVPMCVVLGFALNWSIAHEYRTRVGLQD